MILTPLNSKARKAFYEKLRTYFGLSEDYLLDGILFVSTKNRYWTITVKCNTIEENKTSAEVTYTFIGLNELGNKINEHSLSTIYKDDLKHWEEEINNYLNQ